ncbi:MAG: MCE family protein, partial [Actinobacteria bacterium]|nr:MCE family protein [Actinomycetota bacterium]
LVKLAAFLAVAGLFAAMEIGTLTGPHTGSTQTYYADFATPDGVSGLRVGNPVQVSGVAVGKVDSISLVNADEARVGFTANHNQPITTNTWAVVRYANLLGQRFLELEQNGPTSTVLRPGGVIPAAHTKPALSLTDLFNGFRPLFAALTPTQVNELSQDIIDILQGQTGVIDDLVAQTASLTSNLVDRDQTFRTVIDSVAQLLQTVATHDSELSQTVVQLQALTQQLHQDGPAIVDSLSSIDGLMGSVSGLLDPLTKQGNLTADINDAASVTGELAKNSALLKPLVDGFVQAFGDFDRITQDGDWINTYLCQAVLITPGQVTVTAAQAVETLTDNDLGSLGGLLGSLLNGTTLAQLALPIPLTLPQGQVGNASDSTRVCR